MTAVFHDPENQQTRCCKVFWAGCWWVCRVLEAPFLSPQFLNQSTLAMRSWGTSPCDLYGSRQRWDGDIAATAAELRPSVASYPIPSQLCLELQFCCGAWVSSIAAGNRLLLHAVTEKGGQLMNFNLCNTTIWILWQGDLLHGWRKVCGCCILRLQ